jgi:hypothetical protein
MCVYVYVYVYVCMCVNLPLTHTHTQTGTPPRPYTHRHQNDQSPMSQNDHKQQNPYNNNNNNNNRQRQHNNNNHNNNNNNKRPYFDAKNTPGRRPQRQKFTENGSPRNVPLRDDNIRIPLGPDGMDADEGREFDTPPGAIMVDTDEEKTDFVRHDENQGVGNTDLVRNEDQRVGGDGDAELMGVDVASHVNV